MIVGTEGRDRIEGGGGTDTICGLDGADYLVGGAGDDRLFGGLDEYSPGGGYWGDVVEPGPGDDYVDLGADGGWEDVTDGDRVYVDQVSYANAPGNVRVDLTTLTATGEGTDTFAATPEEKFTGIVGSPFRDILTGGLAADQIHGGGRGDVIDGAGGDDMLHGDLSRDPDGRNVDTYVPSRFDRVTGGAGNDIVEGGYGADYLGGGQGDDYVYTGGDARLTRLDGGPGDDTFGTSQLTIARGGSGDDQFTVSTGNGRRVDKARTIAGGHGRDGVTFTSDVGGRITYDLAISVPRRTVTMDAKRLIRLLGNEEFVVDGNTGRGLVTFHGGSRRELFRVRATGFPTRAFGGGGADHLIGGTRDDLLDGGPGRDRLDGRNGRDRCLRGERLRSCERRR